MSIDTPSAQYRIAEGYIGKENRKVRALLTGPTGAQSGVYTDGSNDLVFWYTKEMARVVEAAPKKEVGLNLLIFKREGLYSYYDNQTPYFWHYG